MARFLLFGFVLITALVIGLYYFLSAPQRDALDAARREASALAQESVSLRVRIADLEGILSELREANAGLEAQIREREYELSLVRSTQQELIGVLQQEIADGQIQVARMQDRLRVNLVNEILFDSGEVTLTPVGIEVLRRVGEVLNRAADKQIIVQGHTDNVAIGGRLARRYPTNWELSAARAVNVARFLQDEVDVDPMRLSAVGFSEYRPRSDNATAAGRQSNRRIEIILAPLPEPFPAPSATE